MTITKDAAPAAHPLDPATTEELAHAVAILRASQKLGERAFFSFGHRYEPSRRELDQHRSGTALERIIQLVGHDRDRGQSFDARISLTLDSIASFEWINEGQAPLGADDVAVLYGILFQNEQWLAALAKRGIEDLSLVHIEPWIAGIHPPEMPAGRVLRALAFLHQHPDDNHYARPVEGLVGLVDVDSGNAVILDHGVHPVPTESANYAADQVEEVRQDLKPLEITQPEGPSFTVDGHTICWQKWRVRISTHPVDGLVLHDLRYRDGDVDRTILHRAALSDMVVPYGDPSPMHFWKHAFDAGETALGQNANSLKLGCDCLGEIQYFDATFLGADGTPYTCENAICLHEEDFGILWKHANVFRPDMKPEVRRSRRLVISMIHTIGNYEYGFYWYFYLDGNIELEVKLTGIVGVSVLGTETDPESSPQIAPSLSSPIHQHLFCFRLDFHLDGPTNSVAETNIEPTEDDNHPYGSGFRARTRPLRTEHEAMRVIDPARSRSWQILNPNKENGLGKPVAYKLLPKATPTLLVPENSPTGRRGGFARHNLWVTPYREDEAYAGAGPFTNLHPGGAGLPAHVADNRSIENTELVVWHSFGVTHVPRPEDWPVMPVEYAGFMLMPSGFFDQSPALDVAPSSTCHTKSGKGSA